jgi:BirA family biotin operon repressor/biotin-[acetyl-CoA-carboxylase] ligase
VNTAKQLQSLLETEIRLRALPWDIEVLPLVDSTSSELMRQAKLGLTAPKILVSLEQTQGRGRRGHHWSSNPSDSLTFSMGLMLKPDSWLGLSPCVGIDLVKTMDPHQDLGLQLKWPNDVWIRKEGQNHKLAGILIETINPSVSPIDSTPQARYCVIGVGVNLNTPNLNPETFSTPPIGLWALGSTLSQEDIVLDMAKRLWTSLKIFESEGFAPFKPIFDGLDALINQPIHLSDGTSGLCLGTNNLGELMLLQGEDTRTINSLEVSVRPLD